MKLVITCYIGTWKFLQFYFKNGRPPPNELKEQCMFRINQFFYGHPDGLLLHGKIHVSIAWTDISGTHLIFVFYILYISEFKLVTKEICKLPSFLSPSLFRKIDVNSIGLITRYTFLFMEVEQLYLYLISIISFETSKIIAILCLKIMRILYCDSFFVVRCSTCWALLGNCVINFIFYWWW